MTAPTALYTPARRQDLLDRLLAALEADTRLAGVVLVGSGAIGFHDRYSDLDLSVAVAAGEDVLAVWRSWRPRVAELAPVLAGAEVIYSTESCLHVLLLEGFLEVDLGFNSLASMVAKRPEWRVVFDRTGVLEEQMARTWAARPQEAPEEYLARRLDGIWHHVMKAAVAICRQQPWAAVEAIQLIRGRALDLACQRLGLESRDGRTAHRLPPESRQRLELTLPADTGAAELARALRAVVAAFFAEALPLSAAFGSTTAQSLQQLVEAYLGEVLRPAESPGEGCSPEASPQ